MEPIDVRRRVGIVFQRPAPFPTMSIYDNVLSGYALNGIRLSKTEKDETVERCLRSVALWDEVKRFEKPHTYYVDLSEDLWNQRNELLQSHSFKED